MNRFSKFVLGYFILCAAVIIIVSMFNIQIDVNRFGVLAYAFIITFGCSFFYVFLLGFDRQAKRMGGRGLF
jgi:hypothetical protein